MRIARSGETAGKRDRERAKRERIAAKRERRAEERQVQRASEPAEDAASVDDLVTQLRELHDEYASGTVSLDEFELLKEQLTARIALALGASS